MASPASDTREGRIEEAAAYVVVALLTLSITLWIMQPWHGDLRVPFTSAGDGAVVSALAKGTVEHGWFEVNPSLGLPGELNMGDYPSADALHYATIKAISLATGNWAAAMNLFFLFTFPLTAVLAFWPMRRLGVSWVPAGLASTLYALLPYHFIRGEPHLFLSAYYLVPPMVLVCLWVGRDEPVLFRRDDAGGLRLSLRSPDAAMSLVVCGLTALAGVYYAFFACFFLAIASALAAARNRTLRPLAAAGLLIATLLVVALLGLMPSTIYRYTHSPNPAASVRNPGQAEIYALKIDQLFLPVDGHRIAKFAQLKAGYREGLAKLSRWLDNEAVITSSLGVLGSLGFLIVIVWPFLGALGRSLVGDERNDVLTRLGEFQIAGVLLATVGGFGAMVAFVLPQIRAYNRIVVFLAYFAFLGLSLLADSWVRRTREGARRWIAWLVIAGVFVLALLDQTSPSFAPAYAANARAFASDAAFVGKIAQTVPAGSAVFQLPYMPFPEPGGPIVNMPDYEPLRGYLQNSSLKWSYGAQKGREVDAWQKSVSALPVAEMLLQLKSRGFSVVWVDRNGYADRGTAIETALAAATGAQPIVSDSGEFSAFVVRR